MRGSLSLKSMLTLQTHEIKNHKLQKTKFFLFVLHALLHATLVLWIKIVATLASHAFAAVFIITLLISRT